MARIDLRARKPEQKITKERKSRRTSPRPLEPAAPTSASTYNPATPGNVAAVSVRWTASSSLDARANPTQVAGAGLRQRSVRAYGLSPRLMRHRAASGCPGGRCAPGHQERQRPEVAPFSRRGRPRDQAGRHMRRRSKLGRQAASRSLHPGLSGSRARAGEVAGGALKLRMLGSDLPTGDGQPKMSWAMGRHTDFSTIRARPRAGLFYSLTPCPILPSTWREPKGSGAVAGPAV
jgi:hypothetical protein